MPRVRKPDTFPCAFCGAPVPQNSASGRTKRFCAQSCKHALGKQRRGDAADIREACHSQRRAIAEVAIDLVDGRQSLDALRSAVAVLRRLRAQLTQQEAA